MIFLENKIPKKKLIVQSPLQQGLKLPTTPTPRGGLELIVQSPLQQGLKQTTSLLPMFRRFAYRTKSITTRIETVIL